MLGLTGDVILILLNVLAYNDVHLVAVLGNHEPPRKIMRSRTDVPAVLERLEFGIVTYLFLPLAELCKRPAELPGC